MNRIVQNLICLVFMVHQMLGVSEPVSVTVPEAAVGAAPAPDAAREEGDGRIKESELCVFLQDEIKDILPGTVKID